MRYFFLNWKKSLYITSRYLICFFLFIAWAISWLSRFFSSWNVCLLWMKFFCIWVLVSWCCVHTWYVPFIKFKIQFFTKKTLDYILLLSSLCCHLFRAQRFKTSFTPSFDNGWGRRHLALAKLFKTFSTPSLDNGWGLQSANWQNFFVDQKRNPFIWIVLLSLPCETQCMLLSVKKKGFLCGCAPSIT